MVLKVGVAQISSESGGIDRNLEAHINAIEVAARCNISFLTFPELSLIGYEPELSQALAISVNDRRLEPLQLAAREHGLVVVAGAAIATGALPQIGSFIFLPDGGIRTYAKMHLHPGEEKYFSVGTSYELVSVGDSTIANAICADTNVTEHVSGCVEKGAKIYISGAMITRNGYVKDTEVLKSYARNYGILVAMANQNSRSGGGQPCGKSAIWTPSGLLALANESQSAIVVAQNTSAGWSGEVIEI
ncbi:carbon-nitrogen hydrolase family protein [Vreelandella sp. EE7]